ncbi:MAG: formate--tetrahydrofolate ligase, partial [Kiritimatiellia bacterium]|nr:formate--tetrahydrofolate ligase [Kiritimatiellia bacterium]
IENIRLFNLPVLVAMNEFTSDTTEEMAVVENRCRDLGVQAIRCDHWARGGQGAEKLAHAVVEMAEQPRKSGFQYLYTDEMHLWNKARVIAQNIYGADNIMAEAKIRQKFKDFEVVGYGHLPICMAKTQYSLSTDPALLGRPKAFDVPIRDVRLSAGAGFVVVLTGEVMTMPGLPAIPSAESIDLNERNEIVGLF